MDIFARRLPGAAWARGRLGKVAMVAMFLSWPLFNGSGNFHPTAALRSAGMRRPMGQFTFYGRAIAIKISTAQIIPAVAISAE